MIRKSKWIEIQSPDEPLGAVARRALEGRLDLIWHYLPLAAAAPEEDVEHVHQCRVATRRAMAALTIFEPLLPQRRAGWFKKQLKRVRRATGEARDYDVMLARLFKECDERFATACRELRREVTRLRHAAQRPIREVHERLVDRGYKRRVGKLVLKTRWRESERSEPTFAMAARSGLRPVTEDFFAAGSADFSDTDALHEFRIAGKELRYAMEVYAGAFEPEFRRDLYPIVEELQQKLGEINDHATAQSRYKKWIDEGGDADRLGLLGELLAQEVDALDRKRVDFVHWWTAGRAADMQTAFREKLAGDR